MAGTYLMNRLPPFLEVPKLSGVPGILVSGSIPSGAVSPRPSSRIAMVMSSSGMMTTIQRQIGMCAVYRMMKGVERPIKAALSGVVVSLPCNEGVLVI